MNDTETSIDPDFLRGLSVLYVEDEEEVRESLARYLRRRFARLDLASNGREGLERFQANRYDVVVTDVRMPLMDGLDMAERIKAAQREMPVIIVTAYNEVDYFLRAIEIGIDRYVRKPIIQQDLVEAIYKSTVVRFRRRELDRKRQCAFEAVRQSLIALAHAIDKRNPYTDGHQLRVARLAAAIAEELRLPPETVAGIELAASIHDIGMLDIPEEILCASRKLTRPEYEIIKTHARAGHGIIGDISTPWPIAEIILQHHERFDGSGYPLGLIGRDILLEARIVAVADVVEAMTSPRPHRPAHGLETAIREIRDRSGTLYDPAVAEACLRVLAGNGPPWPGRPSPN
jgi:putative two-component system response regulator